MTHLHGILAKISKDEGLLQQLRAGDLSAFEKLNLSFNELYLSGQNAEHSWGVGDCTGCNISVQGVEDSLGASATGCAISVQGAEEHSERTPWLRLIKKGTEVTDDLPS